MSASTKMTTAAMNTNKLISGARDSFAFRPLVDFLGNKFETELNSPNSTLAKEAIFTSIATIVLTLQHNNNILQLVQAALQHNEQNKTSGKAPTTEPVQSPAAKATESVTVDPRVIELLTLLQTNLQQMKVLADEHKQVTQEIEQLDQKIDAVDKQVIVVQQQQHQTQERVEEIDSQFTQVQTEYVEIKQEAENLQKQLATQTTTPQPQQTEKSTEDNSTQKAGELMLRLNKTERKMSQVQNQQQQIQTQQREISNNIDTLLRQRQTWGEQRKAATDRQQQCANRILGLGQDTKFVAVKLRGFDMEGYPRVYTDLMSLLENVIQSKQAHPNSVFASLMSTQYGSPLQVARGPQPPMASKDLDERLLEEAQQQIATVLSYAR